MIFACRTPHTPATLFSRTDGLDMKVSTRQKQGATRHNNRGAKGDNSASSAPEGPSHPVIPRLTRPIGRGFQARLAARLLWGCFANRPLYALTGIPLLRAGADRTACVGARHVVPARANYCRGLQCLVGALLAAPQLATMWALPTVCT
jgi:hypothetical protein